MTSPASRIRAWIAGGGLGWLGPVAGLIVVFLLFAIRGPASFSSRGNIETIFRQTAIVGSAALGALLGTSDGPAGSGLLAVFVMVVVAALGALLATSRLGRGRETAAD